MKKVVNGVTTVFHYDQWGQLIAESNGAGSITAEYVYLNGAPLAKIEGVSVYYYHNDALGTPQKMTDSTGAVVWAADYKPFGEATITVSTITNNLRGIGQYFDVETGLLYNYFRDLNPAIGKYIEADPIGLNGGINPFVFVGNNPLLFFDPFGLLDSKKMVDWLNKNAKKDSSRRCAAYVRQGMEAGGEDTSGRPNYAKDYGPFLEKLGFKPVESANYTPKIGDIAVFQGWPGVDPGHIQVYNGTTWISDFVQPGFLPNRKATDYQIYRQP